MKTLGSIALFFALIIFGLMLIVPVVKHKTDPESGEVVK